MLLLGAVFYRPTALPPYRHGVCPAPRVSQWSSIRDSLWPLITHQDGDELYAHLDPAGLPPNVASWCNPLQADAEAITAGHAIYTANCASCHGDRGKGDGPGAGQSDIRPFDFTQPVFAGMREPPGTAVQYAIITRGIAGTTMGAHANALSGWERLAVIAYIGTFPPRDAITQSRAWADSLRARKH